MIPGKKYTPDELFGIVWHRKWLVVVCAMVGAVIAFGYARTMPARYESDTLIMVIAQRVPEKYVSATVTNRIEDRLKSISQEILSRVRLDRIIAEFDLYQNLRSRQSMDEIVQRMKDDIDVRLVGSDSFRVSYISDDPKTAMKVTERLASLFIEENLRDRKVVADDTSDFLDSQLTEARNRLEEKEKLLADYRRTHSGELPTQLDSNQQILQNTQMQLQGLQESLARDRDRRLALDRDLTSFSEAEINGAQKDTTLAPSIADQLEKERLALKTLTGRYTDEHPDVINQRKVVKDLELQLARETTERRTAVDRTPALPTGPTTAAVMRQKRVKDLRAELEATDRQIAARQLDERRLRDTMEQIRRRIDATPTRESELTALTRDYDTVSKLYLSLLAKKEDSKIAANLERRQIGEQFKILDPARTPVVPASPNRPKMTATGAGIGLALALALIAFIEYRNSALRDEDELSACTGLPVVAVIPMMTPPDLAGPTPRIRRLLGSLAGTSPEAPVTPGER
jgi:polysaccharide chain length determinant protein (PEP-CTERM system associated)